MQLKAQQGKLFGNLSIELTGLILIYRGLTSTDPGRTALLVVVGAIMVIASMIAMNSMRDY